jgi:beta-galactosidase
MVAGCTAEYTVPYAPGRFDAVAWRGGAVIGRRRLDTVGPATSLSMSAEPRGAALIYLPIAVHDAAGRVLPDDSRELSLELSGPATLVGFGSANKK